jgi:hypothetical protein
VSFLGRGRKYSAIAGGFQGEWPLRHTAEMCCMLSPTNGSTLTAQPVLFFSIVGRFW